MKFNTDRSKLKVNLWVCPDIDGENQITEIWKISTSPSVRLLIVTLMKKIKPRVTKKHHFDKRENWILINNFWENLDYQDCDGKINFHCFWSNTSTILIGFSIQISLEELKPVILENYEI